MLVCCGTLFGQNPPAGTNEDLHAQRLELLYQLEKTHVLVGKRRLNRPAINPLQEHFVEKYDYRHAYLPVRGAPLDSVHHTKPSEVVGFGFTNSIQSNAINGTEIQKIVELYSEMECVQFYRPNAFAYQMIDQLPKLTNLRELTIVAKQREAFGGELNVPDSRDTSIFKAIGSLANLETLKLENVFLDDDLFRHLSKLSRLERLVITPLAGHIHDSGYFKVDASTFADVIGEMKQLKHLHVSHLSMDGEMDWSKLASHDQLVEVKLPDCNFVSSQLESIKEMQAVRNLDLSHSAISGDAASYLATLRDLETIDLSHTGIDHRIVQLGKLPKIRKITSRPEIFDDLPFSVEHLKYLLRFGGKIRVDSLSLKQIHENASDGIQSVFFDNYRLIVGFKHQEAPASDSKLQRISLQRIPTDRDYIDLAKINTLEDCRFWIRDAVTSEKIQPIRGLPNLKRLRFQNAQFDQDFAELVASLPKLEQLAVSSGTIGAGAMQPLENAKRLSNLFLKLNESKSGESKPEESETADSSNVLKGLDGAPSLTSVTLALPGISDADCATLAKMQTLKNVRVYGNLTDGVFEKLANLSSLESLSLGGFRELDVEDKPRALRKNRNLNYLKLFGPSDNPGHDLIDHGGTYYSESLARELGVLMGGACSCSCMDIDAKNSVDVPVDQCHFEGDSLQIGGQGIGKRDYIPLRILGPINRRRLVISGLQFSSTRTLYLNDCNVDQVELWNWRGEIGIFGRIGEIRIRDISTVENAHPSLTLYTSDTQRVILNSSNTLKSFSANGKIGAISIDGKLPLLNSVHLGNLSRKTRIAAPIRRQTPRLMSLLLPGGEQMKLTGDKK